MKTTLLSMRPKLAFAAVSAMLAIAGLTTALKVPAAQTDISQSPVASSATAVVKPNIMLLMDTSASMGYTHMPDEIEGNEFAFPIGYRSYQCNTLYYNPNKQYRVPKNSDGTTMPAPMFTAARYNYYSTTDTSVVDLSASFKAFETSTRRNQGSNAALNDTAQKAYYFVYSGPQVNTLSYVSAPCTDPDNTAINQENQTNAAGGGLWYRKIVSETSGPGASDERVNFAIWYTYYRTRLALTKSSVALAFSPLSERYRVGFSSMNPTVNPGVQDSPVSAAKYLALNDFDQTQRNAWFSKLFSQTASGSSPAREALARIGRLYAGKNDYINKDMGPDPVQYSCQQNFTIMTTDGYWNTAQESRGPVGLDGQTKVGQQDGTLTDNSGLTPRPIWDGGIGGSRLTTDKLNRYTYVSCLDNYFMQSTSQIRRTTSRVTQSTSQLQQTSSQVRQTQTQITKTTNYILQSTQQLTQRTSQPMAVYTRHQETTQGWRETRAQTFQSKTQLNRTTEQMYESTQQWVRRTFQNTATTSYLEKSTFQTRQSTYQQFEVLDKRVKTTAQRTKTTSQVNEATSQLLKRTFTNRQSTSQLTKVTSRTARTTSQTKQSTVQNLESTSQLTRSTSQRTRATSQRTKATSQLVRYFQQTQQVKTTIFRDDGANETSEAVMPPCAASGNFSCRTVVQTAYLPTTSCTAAPPDLSNDYTRTECNTTTTTKVGVASCTAAPGNNANNYLQTVCETLTTPATGVQTCTPGTDSNYVVTTCSTVTSPATGVASCTDAAASETNSWVATTCNTVSTGPTGVASCVSGTDSNFVITTCNTVTTTNVPVQTCTPGTNANFKTTTCSQATSGPTAVATCAQSSGTSPDWIKITCQTIDTPATAIAKANCTPVTNPSGPDYIRVACNTTNDPGVGVASCTPVPNPPGPDFVTTECPTLTTTNVAVASCTPSGASSNNQYTTTTCPAPTSVSEVGAASCTESLNTIPNVTCRTATTGPTLVAACTANAGTSSPFKKVTCTPTALSSGPTGVESCTDQPAAAPDYIKITCANVNTGPTAVKPDTCLVGTTAAAESNQWTMTKCEDAATVRNAVASCSPSTASNPLWTTRTCDPQTTTNVPVQTCTANPGSASPYKRVTCSQNNTGPVRDATCRASAATVDNQWTLTTCTGSNTTAGSGSCIPQSGNTTVTCGTNNTGPTFVENCSPQIASSNNDWISITCENRTTTNDLKDVCTPSGKTLLNDWKATTCNKVTETLPAGFCANEDPGPGNNHTRTTCADLTVEASHPVASCIPVLPAPGNTYTETKCDSSNTTYNYANKPVASCPSNTGFDNAYATITCSEVGSGPTFVANCTPGTNPTTQITTSCTDVVSAPTPISSCTSPPGPSSSNNWATVTSCNVVMTGPTGVQFCTPGTNSNFVTTTCPTVTDTKNVATCTDARPSGDNNWVDTTCNTVTTPEFVTSCTGQVGNSTNSFTTITCNTMTDGPKFVQNCSAGTGANSLVTTCDPVVTTIGVQTCSSATASSPDWKTITCNTVNNNDQGVASCTPSGPIADNGYMTTTCGTPVVTQTFEPSCTNAAATLANNWTSVSCETLTTGPTQVQGCVTAGATNDNSYKATTCVPVPGEKVQYQTTTTTDTRLTSGTMEVGEPTNVNVSVGPVTDLDGMCHVVDKLTYAKPTDGRPTGSLPPVATCSSGWPCKVDTPNTQNSGSFNSLADVAQYYYVTDLRPNQVDDVATTGTGPEDDRASWQHMTTFAMGLGVSGTLKYDTAYKSATTGDFADIRSGAKNWPAWPDASIDYSQSSTLYNDARSIDDFWHAAVNGRGRYFSANDPDAVINGLNDALAGIKSRSGSGASATLSNPAPSAGDNLAFITSFTSEKWTGNLEAYEIDLATGNIGNTSAWSTQPRVDAVAGASCDSRKIYTYRAGASNNFGQFTWNTRACDATLNPIGAASTDLTTEQQELFSITQASTLTQYLDMTDGLAGTQNQRAVVAGSNLVNYLRGQRGMEGFVSNNAAKLYRSREHVLGDLVGSQPAYVKAPSSSYQDAGYTAFKADNAARTPVVYVGGNDGMLHAFKAPTTLTDGTAGNELWAFMPTPVMKNLFRLADTEYGAQHIFAVDGSPVSGDFYDTTSNTWKTMLVGGLGAGGKGYYALDVTNPTSPKALWEFTHGDTCFVTQTGTPAYTDCHLGLTFGKPLVTKLQDGRWVVIVSSGYNNVNSPAKTGDGVGYVYVLSAATGEILYKIATNEGTSDSPSGLRELSNYVPAPEVDNTTQRVYGGDLNGWIYRVDVNGIYEPTGREASKVARALDANNAPQPITTRVQLAEYDGKTVLLAGTGQLLGTSDVLTTQTQSVYGFFDSLTSSIVIDNLRTTLKPMTLTTVGSGSTATRTIACAADTVAKCNVIGNWYLDLNQAGERISVDMRIALGTLTFTSNVPESSACSAGGTSWINYVDLLTGNSVSSSADGVVSRRLSDTLTTGLTLFLSNGGVRFISQNAQTRGGTSGTGNSSIGPISGAGGLSNTGETPTTPQKALGRRISWREITENN